MENQDMNEIIDDSQWWDTWWDTEYAWELDNGIYDPPLSY